MRKLLLTALLDELERFARTAADGDRGRHAWRLEPSPVDPLAEGRANVLAGERVIAAAVPYVDALHIEATQPRAILELVRATRALLEAVTGAVDVTPVSAQWINAFQDQLVAACTVEVP